MDKNQHEISSKILGQAIEMPKAEALNYIKKQCGNDQEFYNEVIGLFEIMSEDDSSAEKSTENQETKLSRIGQKNAKTKVIGGFAKKLFDNKKSRLAILLLLYLLLAFGGYLVRAEFKKIVVSAEQEKLETLLKTQSESVLQWIERERSIIDALSKSPEIMSIAIQLDSLASLDLSYKYIQELDLNDSVSQKLIEQKNRLNLEAIGFIHKRDPVIMIHADGEIEGSDSLSTHIELDGAIYDYLKHYKTNDATYNYPPFPAFEVFETIPENLKTKTFQCFTSPVFVKDEIIGYILVSYNVANTLTSIMKMAEHGNSLELYAFSWDTKLLTTSRFEKEMQQTVLMGFDSTVSTIQNFQIKDPGGDITIDGNSPLSYEDQSLTDLVVDFMWDHNADEPTDRGAVLTPYRDYRGIEVVGAWGWYYRLAFGIIAEEDTEDAFVSLRYFDGALILFYLILALLIFILYKQNLRFLKFGKKIKDLETLGQYHIQKKIGNGGFGDVYLAQHNFLKTPVAIKQLKKEFIGTDMLDRFEKEVKVTASLANPHTIRVYDYGKTELGQFYYVMEYLEGITLEKLVELYEEFPISRAIFILRQICYSLAEAHKKGLIHRDIKPGNIMVCNQGGEFDMVKVLDFGLVKNINTSQSQQTELNRIGGTPMFMAPERLRDPYNNDQRVDIYALGAVGLHMLSGKFVMELISQKMLSGDETVFGDFKSGLIKRKDIPTSLNDLLQKSISFEASKRPSSVTEFLEDLENLQTQYPWTREDAGQWWSNYDTYA